MPEKILLIDDEEAIRDSIGILLRKEGYEVDSAANGREAVERVQSTRYDLIITDIRMPGMDGIEVVDRIREHAPLQKIMMITGFGSIETALQAKRRGAVDYLMKPFSLAELKDSVHRALRQAGTDASPDGPSLDHKLKDLATAFSLLSEFTNALNASLDIGEILDATLSLLHTIGQTASASVVLFPDRIHEQYFIKEGGPLAAVSRGKGISPRLADAGPWLTSAMILGVDGGNEESSGPERAVRTLVRETMTNEGFQQALFLPITVKDTVIGIADVCTAEDRSFSETDRNFMTAVVNQLSLALAKALSYLELEERAREIGLLYNLSSTLNQSLTATDSIKAICESAAAVTAASGAVLQTSFEPGAIRHYVFSSATGFTTEVRYGDAPGILSGSSRSEAFISNDPASDGRLNSATVTALGVRRIAAVPLISEWDNLGTLAVYASSDDRPFDRRDLHLLHLFARHAAEVLLNAQLLDTIKKSREKIMAEKRAFDDVLHAVADGVMTIDAECRITHASEPLLGLLGQSATAVVGRRCNEVLVQGPCSEHCPVPDSAATGRPATYDALITASDGRAVSARVALAPVRTTDGTVHAWIKAITIKDRKDRPAERRRPRKSTASTRTACL